MLKLMKIFGAIFAAQVLYDMLKPQREELIGYVKEIAERVRQA